MLDTVKVSKIKGHIDQFMVAGGSFRQEDFFGNGGADTAADLGRLRQNDGFIGARRASHQARRHWYPIVVELHEFMVAVSRVEVNHDGHGGTAPDSMVWENGSVLEPRSSSIRVIKDHASLPGPSGLWDSSWCGVSCSLVTQEDVAVWPHSVNILLEFTAFLASQRWLQGDADLVSVVSPFFFC